MMKNRILITMLSFLCCTSEYAYSSWSISDNCELVLLNSYMLKPIHLNYIEVSPAPIYENLTLPGKEGKYGMDCDDKETRMLGIFVRAMRFENITSSVEDKYDLPRYTLLAMLMQECNGINYLPNGKNDGGIGLIHMQPMIAHQFGLKTHGGCRDLVSLKHGMDLRNLVNAYADNKPEELLKYDDRFHPVLNVDAAGRMIKYYSSLKMIGKDSLDSAFKRYAGKYNYAKYTANIRHFIKHLFNEEFMESIELKFNELHPNLIINGEASDFKRFIAANHEYNRNFDLDKYQKAYFGPVP